MGGGNAQKSKTARERNMEKNKASKGFLSFFFLNWDNFLLESVFIISQDYVPYNWSKYPEIEWKFWWILWFGAGSQLEANKKAMNIQVYNFLCSYRF